jgi:hypothetical protein
MYWENKIDLILSLDHHNKFVKVMEPITASTKQNAVKLTVCILLELQ